MELVSTPLTDVLEVTSPAFSDARGNFRRTWSAESFAAAGITFTPTQTSLSTNRHRLTLRGMHWQATPHVEQKLVRCVAGAVWDVGLDLRPGSLTYKRWHAVTLSAEAGNAFFLPRGIGLCHRLARNPRRDRRS